LAKLLVCVCVRLLIKLSASLSGCIAMPVEVLISDAFNQPICSEALIHSRMKASDHPNLHTV